MSFSGYYNELAMDPNNLSYWYPKIKDCGIKTPKTAIIPVPENIAELFFMEKAGMTPQEIMEEIYAWVKGEFIPQAQKVLTGHGFWFIKNGSFSNKFTFNDCKVSSHQPMMMTEKIVDINYTALMYDADGITEMIAREFIEPPKDAPCIYQGMPLRAEVRVFYDFDHHHVVYAVNYWDADYCSSAICRDPTDGIVYQNYYPTILNRYDKIKDAAIALVEAKMEKVQGFTGIWSIDLMDNPNNDDVSFYLIDMAIGSRSAYWDVSKIERYNANITAGKEYPWVT